MLNLDERMDIKLLYREGHSIREIASLTGRSRNTVRKVLKNGYDPSVQRKVRKSLLDNYKDYIELKFKDGRSTQRILKDIQKMGYKGSGVLLYRFLEPYRDEIRRKDKLTVRFETAPGEQAQVDWGHCGQIVDTDGLKKNLYVFAYLLSYSRACYMEFCTSTALEVLIKCHKNAFDYFSGVPENILYDNMKTVRLGPCRLNPAFVDFTNYYGFVIRTCRPYRPRTKGKVERLIEYFRSSFLSQEKFTSLDDANAKLRHWLEHEANCRVHGTTGERPCDLLKKEGLASHLKKPPFRFINKVTRKATTEGFVLYQGNRYSVPVNTAGKTVELEHFGTTIRIRLKDMIVTEHKQATGKDQAIIHKEHLQSMWKLTLSNSRPPEHKDIISFNRDIQERKLSIYDEVCQ